MKPQLAYKEKISAEDPKVRNTIIKAEEDSSDEMNPQLAYKEKFWLRRNRMFGEPRNPTEQKI
eukprot:UN23049